MRERGGGARRAGLAMTLASDTDGGAVEEADGEVNLAAQLRAEMEAEDEEEDDYVEEDDATKEMLDNIETRLHVRQKLLFSCLRLLSSLLSYTISSSATRADRSTCMRASFPSTHNSPIGCQCSR
jgi:hypothetical protein